MSRITAWLLLAAAVVVGAVGQGLTSLRGAALMDQAFVWSVLASAVLLMAQLAAIAAAAARVAGARPSWRAATLWTAVVTVGGMLLAVLIPLALPLVVVAALCVLSAVSVGHGPQTAFAVFRRVPARAITASVVSILLSASTWVVALLCGFFVAGVVGGVAMWLWFGAVATLQLVWWSRLQLRAARAAASVSSSAAATSAATDGSEGVAIRS